MTMPPPPMQQPPPYVRPPGNGSIAWIVGLIVLLCLPFVGSLLAAALMIGLGLAQRSKGGLAAHNGASAATWGVIHLVATIVLVGAHFGLVFWVTGGEGADGFFPVGIPITVWGLVSLVHLVMCIWGTVVTSQNRPFGFGVSFFRAR